MMISGFTILGVAIGRTAFHAKLKAACDGRLYVEATLRSREKAADV